MARKKKVKVKGTINEDGILEFARDGLDEREYLIVITSSVFFGGVALGLLITIISMFTSYELPPAYLELIGVMSSPLMVILGGIFTVKTAQVITDKKNKKDDVVSENNHNEESDI